MPEAVHVERSRLAQDPRLFFDFFRSFSSAPMPLVFLEQHALSEAELFRLLGDWQRKLAADPALQTEVLSLLRDAHEPLTNVGPSKLELLPAQEEKNSPAALPEAAAPPPASLLAMTSLGLALDRPALPFVKPSSERPTLPISPAPLRAAPMGLGETKPVFRVDRALLPFASGKVETKDEPLPLPSRPAPRALAETGPSLFGARPALPFQPSTAPVMSAKAEPKIAPAPRSLSETRPVFHTYKAAALPFPKSLGQTAPSFQVDKSTLPFVKGEARLPPKEASKPSSSLGETSLLLGVNLSAMLPFAKPSASTTRLSVDAYATLCAEIWLAPSDALAIIARYGLSPDAKRAEDAAWQARFSASPKERTEWERLAIEAGARIRERLGRR